MAVQIDIRANSEQAKRNIDQLNNSVKNIERSTQEVNNGFRAIGKTARFAALAITAAFSGSALTRAGDTAKQINTQLRLATRNAQALARAQQNVNRIAIQTRNNLQSTANLFARLNRSAIQLGRSQAETVKATRAITQAIQISGASAASAQAAIIQLGQGLASGTLRGEELNSVLEQTPRIAKAIADELGVSVGQLRKVASEGKLTSEVVFKALVNQSAQISKEFQQVELTIGQATSVLNTGITTFLASLDRSLGLSTALAKRILIVGKFLNDFGLEFEDRLTILRIRFRLFRDDIVNTFKSVGKSINATLGNITFSNISFDIKSDVFANVKEKIERIKDQIKSLTNFKINIDFSGLDSTINTVSSFVNKIGKYFYDLYIYLVGNSIVPDMVQRIIEEFELMSLQVETTVRNWSDSIVSIITGLVSKSLVKIGDFSYQVNTKLDEIKENELVKEGFTKLETSVEKLKSTQAFKTLETGLNSAKEKAIEIGTSLKEAFNQNFSLTEESKSSLKSSIGLALAGAASADLVISAFKTLFSDALTLLRPVALLTIAETFGSDIAKAIRTIDFNSIGNTIGTGFREVVSKGGSSGTVDIAATAGAGLLDIASGAFEGAIIESDFSELLDVAIGAAFIASVASSGFRNALRSTAAFVFTGGSISDRIGPLGQGRDVNIDKIGEQRASAIQRTVAGIGAIAGGLIANEFANAFELGPAGQIGAAIVGAMAGSAAAAAMARAGVALASAFGIGLLATKIGAIFTAIGATIGSGILGTLALASALLFPEETLDLLEKVFGKGARDIGESIRNAIRDAGKIFKDGLKQLFNDFLSLFPGGNISKKENTPTTTSLRQVFEDTIDNFATNIEGLSAVDKGALSNARTLLSSSIDLSNQELAVQLRDLNTTSEKARNLLEAIASNLETTATTTSTRTPSIGELISPNVRIPDTSTPANLSLRETLSNNLSGLRGFSTPQSDPRNLLERSIKLLSNTEKNNLELANELRKLNTRSEELNKAIQQTANALESVFQIEQARKANAQRENAKRSGFANGGRVFGSGTSKSDSIPAMLSNGEFVVNAKSTSRNLGLLSAINGGMNPGGNNGRFNDGGLAALIETILKHEGGKSNHKLDAGGKTNFGITQKVYTGEGYSGDVFDLTKQDAINFYKKLHSKSKINRFNSDLQAQIFDIIINSGYGNAANMFQSALGIMLNGKPAQTNAFGPSTIAAINKLTNDEMVKIRLDYFDKIVKEKPNQQVFLKGWRKRAKSFMMASGGRVSGPGTGRSDDIPAMLSNGEFVVNAKATSRNRQLLESINKGGVRQFNAGGLNGSSVSSESDSVLGVVKQLKELTDKTVSPAQLLQLNEAQRTTIKMSLATLGAINERILAGNYENLEKELADQKELKAIIDKKLSELIKEVKGEGTDKGLGEKLFGAIDLNQAGNDAAKDFNNALRTAILEGEGGGIKSLLKGFLDSFTASIVNQFFDSLQKEFMDNLFSENGPFNFDGIAKGFSGLLSKAFSGISSSFSGIGSFLGIGGGAVGGADIGSTYGNTGFSPSFDVGGIVPGMPGEPVPALVHGGEVILNREQQRAVFEKGAGVNGTTTVNLNVTGDVSRQTRNEIERMIPQITSGVNQRNAETGFDRG